MNGIGKDSTRVTVHTPGHEVIHLHVDGAGRMQMAQKVVRHPTEDTSPGLGAADHPKVVGIEGENETVVLILYNDPGSEKEEANGVSYRPSAGTPGEPPLLGIGVVIVRDFPAAGAEAVQIPVEPIDLVDAAALKRSVH